MICGSDRHVVVECPIRHDAVGRQQDDVWNDDAIQKVEKVQPQEKGIRSALQEIVR